MRVSFRRRVSFSLDFDNRYSRLGGTVLTAEQLLAETKAEKIRRLAGWMPISQKARRTARIVAFRALRQAEEKRVQERLNGHFDFED